MTESPESSEYRVRVRRLTPTDLNLEQQALYDAIVTLAPSQNPPPFRVIDASGALEGPFNGYLHQPKLGAVLQDLGDAMRDDTSLTSRARELAILVVAAGLDGSFAWYAHDAIGRAVGLTDKEIFAVRDRRYDDLEDPYERLIVGTTDLLVARGDLNDADYFEAVDALGHATVVELLTLVGFYSLLILQMRVLRVAVPTE